MRHGRIGADALRVIRRLHLQKPQCRHLKVPAEPSRHRGREVLLSRQETAHRAALYAETWEPIDFASDGRSLVVLSSRDREILTRFYLQEESQEEICIEMTLTETQFRLLKSRAKSRFGELGKKKLGQRNLGAVCMRTSAGGSH